MAAAKKTSASSGAKTTSGKKTTKKPAARSTKSTANSSRPRTSKKTGRKSAAAVREEQRRKQYIIGTGLFILAGIVALALQRMDGILLNGITTVFGGLLGQSISILCVALILAGMFVMMDVPAMRLRSVCILLEPVFYGALIQSIRYDKMTVSFTSVITLWQRGGGLTGGGVLGGMLGTICSALISPFGTKLLMLVLITLAGFIAANTTPARIYRRMVAFLEDDATQLRESDMTVTPAKKPKTAKKAKNNAKNGKAKRGSFFAFLRDRRGRRKAAKLRAQQEQWEEQEPQTQQQPEQQPSGAMQKFREKQARERRLRDAVPNMTQPNINVMPDEPEEEVLPWDEPLEPADIPVHEPPIQEAPIQQAPVQQPEPPAVNQKVKEDPTVTAQMHQNIAASMQAPVPEYDYPSLELLKSAPRVSNTGVRAELKESSARLVDTLASFGIDVQIINIVRGPSVTRFELQMERGIKFSRITALSDDIALALGADSVRIAPIPDKVAIGVEVPNRTVQMVMLRDVLASKKFAQTSARLAVALGKDITGADQVIDLAKMPHLLIAGTTGSGKSVCINSILISLLYKSSPEDVRLIMIDPKMVELGNYNGIPHLLVPVVTDPKKASGALSWAVGEMERRYSLFAANSVRNLSDYNALVKTRQAQPEPAEGEKAPRKLEHLPQIVIVIDELADLMMVAAKEVETSICRIAQKARAAGMHLVVATQRPSADVITGIMKSNIPSRIAFAVASQVESRIILDGQGAEKLIGKGDMLYSPIGMNKPVRIQGCFVSSEEIEHVIAHVKVTSQAEYSEEVMAHIEREAEAASSGGDFHNPAEDEDELLPQAITIVCESGQASVSMLQRRLKLGYARAARLVDQMEQRGIVGPFEGSKPRQVLISKEDWMQIQLRQKY